ncbi:AtpZ/AtpI family protein [Paraglaciecola sp. L1A13]|uniref:AtpZ/AtpI family protein n=1 Tax=Paraglaciecola sp. L1A13 TaxID=2686359 RepID=UPI00131B2B4C|nr:AtpZ/AtpI family protein [Paraglaciecola sp. L1A13]
MDEDKSSSDPSNHNPGKPSFLVEQVDAKVALKLLAKRRKHAGIWFGLGTMGIIGWSITVPTLIGVGLGIWLDKHYGDQRSWTLALLLAGLAIGCFTAWSWISKEYAAMHNDDRNSDDNDE